MPSFLPSIPFEVPVAATVPLLVLVALLLGELVTRVRVPRLLGYLAAGVGFAWLGEAVGALPRVPAFGALAATVEVAAALILFDLGQRVSFAWVLRNPWLALASVLESALTFLCVFLALRAFDVKPLIAALSAAAAIATSPAILLAVVRETRAQGQVTERALLLTAFNCMIAVVVSTLLLAWALAEREAVFEEFVLHPLYLVFGSLLLASVAARLLLLVARVVGRERYVQWLVMVAMVSLVVTMAPILKVSSLLALLSFGAFARGFDQSRRLTTMDLGPLSSAAILLVITLSAAALSGTTLAFAWGPALALLLVR
ncbi:MAG TPA: cation:proton antiporter, partial [Burkholderiaceae bacterium]|nr:cation:proton antiporter [Burkholderiaceae bacterium]